MYEIRTLIAYLGKRRRLLMIFVVSLMVVVVFFEVAVISLVVPFLSAIFGDEGYVSPIVQFGIERFLLSHPSHARDVFLVFFVIMSSTAGLRLMLAWVGYRFTYAIGADLGARVISTTLSRPYAWHLSNNSGETLATFVKVDSAMHVLNQLLQALSATIVGVVILIAMLCINAVLFASVGAALAICYLFIFILTKNVLSVTAI